MAIQVVLADDHVIVRNGLKALLESEPEITVIGEASDGKEALEVVKNLKPDVVILDISMPLLNGIETARQIHKSGSSSKCLMLSMYDNEAYVLQSIESGASGYLLKDSEKEELLKAIKEIAQGKKYFSSPVANILADNYLNKRAKEPRPEPKGVNDYELTRKEVQILQLVAQGFSNKDIAEKLGKSIRTVETQRFNLMKKLDVKNVVELVNFVKENKVIDVDNASD